MMFEGKPPSQDASASLRPVSWAELSARLAAARDFRKAFAEDDEGEGSFDAASARWIADHSTDHVTGKPDVNFVDLGNRKPTSRMAGPQRVLPMPGDRGK